MIDKEKLNEYRKDYRQEFGEKFKKLRKSSDYTQQKLAELLGWPSSQYVANIENGYASFPAEKIRLLCKLVNNISPEEIIDDLIAIEKRILKSRVFNKKF